MCDAGDYMYPSKPDYEGTEDMLPPLLSSSVEELNDVNCTLNRVIFANRETVLSLSQIDTTAHDTSIVDHLLQNGTVVCNI